MFKAYLQSFHKDLAFPGHWRVGAAYQQGAFGRIKNRNVIEGDTWAYGQ